MGQGRKLYEEWRDRGVPADGVLVTDGEKVLNELLPGAVDCCRGGSHKYVVRHPWMRSLARYAGGADNFVIVVTKGRRVKQRYIKLLVDVLRYLDWVRAEHDRLGLPCPPEDQPIGREYGVRYEEHPGR